jgi:hypothetical protein
MSFDWRTRLHTSDPEYYRWNQWLFLRMFDKGLAYRKSAPVNWCPVDKTVLANEQVIQGKCERCGSEVVARELTQWFFRTTAYAQRLLDDMAQLEDGKWPHEILTMQRNWIGRSEGAHIGFRVEGHEEPVRVFSTRPDTLYGATFFVVAADAPLARELCAPEQLGALEGYLREVGASSEIERLATDRPKTGVALNRYAVNPLHHGVPGGCFEQMRFQRDAGGAGVDPRGHAQADPGPGRRRHGRRRTHDRRTVDAQDGDGRPGPEPVGDRPGTGERHAVQDARVLAELLLVVLDAVPGAAGAQGRRSGCRRPGRAASPACGSAPPARRARPRRTCRSGRRRPAWRR